VLENGVPIVGVGWVMRFAPSCRDSTRAILRRALATRPKEFHEQPRARGLRTRLRLVEQELRKQVAHVDLQGTSLMAAKNDSSLSERFSVISLVKLFVLQGGVGGRVVSSTQSNGGEP
jgi:hypothetical protein